MKVICIEGCHGCGKTELIKWLKSSGENVIDEGFLDMPKFSLNPQSFTMELLWVAKWIERILTIREAAAQPGTVVQPNEMVARAEETVQPNGMAAQLIYADRSPFSALFYAPDGDLMREVIKKAIENMLQEANIEIKTIYIRVDSEILWGRITDRLKVEPYRIKYREDSRDWMNTTVQFYEKNVDLWDVVVDNDSGTIDLTGKKIQQFASM
jgi:thymidylate kinase